MEMDMQQLAIGEQLRMKRLFEHKSQTDIGAELAINRSYLSLYELGRLSITAEHREKILEYINA